MELDHPHPLGDLVPDHPVGQALGDEGLPDPGRAFEDDVLLAFQGVDDVVELRPGKEEILQGFLASVLRRDGLGRWHVRPVRYLTPSMS